MKKDTNLNLDHLSSKQLYIGLQLGEIDSQTYYECISEKQNNSKKRSLMASVKKWIRKFFYLMKRFFFGEYKNEYYINNFHDHLKHDRVVVFDTETTGLDTINDDIIQIAAIEILQGKVSSQIMMYFYTDKNLSPTQTVHNISNNHLKEKSINKQEGLKQFIEFIGDSPLIAHNIKFDYAILNSNLKKEFLNTVYKNKLFCTLILTRQIFPKLDSFKLGNILRSLNIEGINNHDALDDTKATVNLVLKLFETITEENKK